VAGIWADATLDENGNAYHHIFAYSTLPKEQCWVYGRTGILAYIMEISDQCWWSDAMVDTIGARVARGSMVLMDRVLDGPGIQGQVVSDIDGSPLVAEVIIHEMHHPEVGPRLTERAGGSYHRLTTSGDYTITASSPGYLPQTHSVTVSDGWETVDFALQSDLSAVDSSRPSRKIQLHCSHTGDGTVRLNMPSGMSPAKVEVFDLRGRKVGNLGSGLGEGTHELALPQRLSGGVYLVRVQAGQIGQTLKVTVVP
jgi:hypothetical protein